MKILWLMTEYVVQEVGFQEVKCEILDKPGGEEIGFYGVYRGDRECSLHLLFCFVLESLLDREESSGVIVMEMLRCLWKAPEHANPCGGLGFRHSNYPAWTPDPTRH